MDARLRRLADDHHAAVVAAGTAMEGGSVKDWLDQSACAAVLHDAILVLLGWRTPPTAAQAHAGLRAVLGSLPAGMVFSASDLYDRADVIRLGQSRAWLRAHLHMLAMNGQRLRLVTATTYQVLPERVTS